MRRAEKAVGDIALILRLLGFTRFIRVFHLVLSVFIFRALPHEGVGDRVWETRRSRHLRVRTLHEGQRVYQDRRILHTMVRRCDRIAPCALRRLCGVLPFSVVIFVVAQLKPDRLLLPRARMRAARDQRLLRDTGSVPPQHRRGVIPLHRMILRMIIHQTVPVYVCGSLGAGNGSCGGGLLAQMVAAGRFGAKLEALQFIKILAEGGVAVMGAVTTAHNVSAMRFMMNGGLGGVRLRQLA